MTREEQIKQASLNENNYILADNEVDCISFQDGARWADSHPHWHKYPEDKPMESRDYYCHYDNGIIEFDIILKYDKFVEEFFGYDSAGEYTQYHHVVAWMEKPKFN